MINHQAQVGGHRASRARAGHAPPQRRTAAPYRQRGASGACIFSAIRRVSACWEKGRLTGQRAPRVLAERDAALGRRGLPLDLGVDPRIGGS